MSALALVERTVPKFTRSGNSDSGGLAKKYLMMNIIIEI